MHTMIPHLVEASNDANTLPPNFDPQRFPIFAVHWFGMRRPARPFVEVVDFQTIRLAVALHGLAKANGIEVGTRADVARRLEVSA